jgi:hypothetical protein
MACCMLGAMFIGQCLVMIENVQKLLGWRRSAVSMSGRFAGAIARHRASLLALLCIEGLSVVGASWAARESWLDHGSHLQFVWNDAAITSPAERCTTTLPPDAKQ